MTDNAGLKDWFCREVLPLERPLMQFIRRNWKVSEDVIDLRQDIYEKALNGARNGLPLNTPGYIFAIARNHLISQARRAKIVSFELVADLEFLDLQADLQASERALEARDQLRRAQQGLANLPPRCREVVRMRKVDGFTTKETAEALGVGVDAVEHQLTSGMRALTDFMLGGSGKIQWKRRSIKRSRGEAR